MHQYIRISHGFWSSTIIFAWLLLAVSGCMSRAPSIRMLDSRAAYGEAPDDEEVALYQRGKHAQDTVLRRASPRVARVYVFPHELPTRDYFWGGYVSLLVAQEWVFEESDEERPPVAGIREASSARSAMSKRSHKHKKPAPAPQAVNPQNTEENTP